MAAMNDRVSVGITGSTFGEKGTSTLLLVLIL
jgi:hypothetical protein